MEASMTRSKSNRPTDGELEILRIIWTNGPSTVRNVFNTLSEIRRTGYTTVLKLMQIMTEKGHLDVDKSVRPQIYSPVESRGKTQKHLVADLLDRAFGGAPGSLVLQALSASEVTAEEREAIRQLLNDQERKSQ
jgi:BlaI family transcriptional regulator, penicillinase repressor